MRKIVQALSLCVFVVLTAQPAVFASVDNWFLSVSAYWTQWGTSGTLGVHPLSSDGYDFTDFALIPSTSVNMGVYKVEGKDGWSGPTGFYTADRRSPLPLTVGAAKTWRFYVWADPKLNPLAETMTLGLSLWSDNFPIGERPIGDQIKFQITLIDKPVGISGGPEIGTSYILDRGLMLELPVFRTDNGLEGYVFDFTATVVPEPSSIAALGFGLLPLGLALRRRRKN